jgi:hypothetical protein
MVEDLYLVTVTVFVVVRELYEVLPTMATVSRHLPTARPLMVKPEAVFVTEQTLVLVDTVMARP